MHQDVELVLPNVKFRDSYCNLVAEFLANGEALVPFTLGFESTNFDALLAKLDACARGVGIPEGFVAHSTFWLIRDGTEVVGVSNIRHSLTPSLLREGGNIGYGIRPSVRRKGYATAILALSLKHASALGLQRVLLTCGKRNVASAKTICSNGGAFDTEEYLTHRDEIVQRYWIDC
jgi:predicted acetyltransferase